MIGSAAGDGGAAEAPEPRMNPARSPLRWLVALAVFVAVAALALWRYSPPLPATLTLDLELGNPGAGKSEPLVTSGRTQAGDFLFVRHIDERTVVFGYETWGSASLLSAPVLLPPDRKLRLEIALPAFTQIRGALTPPTDRLRLTAAGVKLFDLTVPFRWRLAPEIRFGENTIGGTTCDATLTGRLRLIDGRELRGAPTALHGFRERIIAWLTVTRWPAVVALLLGVATFAVWPRLGACDWSSSLTTAVGVVTRHRWFIATAALCLAPFAWLVTYGTLKFVAPETFNSFYDFQAVSLLQGRLDVPEESLSGEAFVFGGKIYGYFGLTPALLRLPLVIFEAPFAEFGRGFMLLYFTGALGASYLMLREAFRLAGRGEDPPPAWATVCFTASVGLGSTLFYLGSTGNVYHEAILCGAMFTLWTCWFALRHFAAPERRWWIGALVCGTLAVHARPPVGFFALTLVATLALAAALRDRHRAAGWRRPALIAALAGAGVFSFNVVSYAKFQTFEGCPLRYNVQYDATRLARIDGKQFHLVNVPIAVDTYLVQWNLHVEPTFPYLFIGATTPGREWLKTKIDYHDPTLGFPYAMPALFALATLGSLSAWFFRPALRWPLAATWAAGAPMSLAMFAAIAITHRYTADFCPLFIMAAALGLAAVASLAAPWRTLARTAFVVTTLASVLITFAITIHHQGKDAWGVPAEARSRYQGIRHAVDSALGFARP